LGYVMSIISGIAYGSILYEKHGRMRMVHD
jgi:hypothetical protein